MVKKRTNIYRTPVLCQPIGQCFTNILFHLFPKAILLSPFCSGENKSLEI